MSNTGEETDTQRDIVMSMASGEVSGFELFDAGVSFLVNLGIPKQDVYTYPEVVVTTIGSLLRQVDRQLADTDEMRQAMSALQRDTNRLRAQRDALRGMMQKAGVDPMANYRSQHALPAINPKDLTQ